MDKLFSVAQVIAPILIAVTLGGIGRRKEMMTTQ